MDSEQLLSNFARSFLGLNEPAPAIRADGSVGLIPRVYLDSAATCLMPHAVWMTMEAYLHAACANSHTSASAQGRTTTQALHDAHDAVGRLVGYNPATDCVVFAGSGATGPMNILADLLMCDSSRPLALVSTQEHHSNFLPWIRSAGPKNVRFIPTTVSGEIDLAALAKLLNENAGRIRVVAITAVSNVTGVINPINLIAEMVHAVGAEIVVDGAQAAAHVPIAMHPEMHIGVSSRTGWIDYLALSGHKLYAPGSPGVLIGRKDTFCDCGWNQHAPVGGGTVDLVDFLNVTFKHDPTERFEAGTPDIPGAVGLGAAALILQQINLATIRQHEHALVSYALDQLKRVHEIIVYGPTDPGIRAGLISFNIGDMAHGLVAAALNDYAAIAVRNDCFCAQPYVRRLIFQSCEELGYCAPMTVERRGMVRASFGVYTTYDDIDRLVTALQWISINREQLRTEYVHDGKGNFQHRWFRPQTTFSLTDVVAAQIGAG